MPPAKLQPALLGGLVIGVFSALPLVDALNGCCCLWVVTGAVLAAYLMQQNHPLPIAIADGALVGLLAGVFGAIVDAILTIPVDLVFGDMQRRIAEQALAWIKATLPPDAQLPFDPAAGDALSGPARFFLMILAIPIYAVFGLLGGVLGASLFRKDQPPAPPATPLVP